MGKIKPLTEEEIARIRADFGTDGQVVNMNWRVVLRLLAALDARTAERDELQSELDEVKFLRAEEGLHLDRAEEKIAELEREGAGQCRMTLK